MAQVKETKNNYVAHFDRLEKELGEKRRSWLHPVRKAAFARFAEVGFPTLRDEEWRFTNVASIARADFQPARPGATVAAEALEPFTFAPAHTLVFVNGFYSAALSSPGELPKGLVARSLADVLANEPKAVEPYLTRFADYKANPFVALNTAFLRDGAFVSVPRGLVLAEPIHLVYVATAAEGPTGSHPRTVLLAGVNSQCTVVESYVAAGDDQYLTNAVTEVVTQENAVVDHYKVQRESEEAFHVATLQVHQGRGSNFSSHAVILGGEISRSDVNAVLDAEGCECTLNGLYLGAGRQLIDNHTRIDHAKPHCASHELYKGILDGRSHGVFNGKIYVHPDAQKTDAKQTNKTLLLSPDATIDTKPQLEIFADDVKCTHGATIGQLAEEAIFYLRSRGIGREEARALLTYAFANDVLCRVKVPAVRERLERLLLSAQNLPEEEIKEAAL